MSNAESDIRLDLSLLFNSSLTTDDIINYFIIYSEFKRTYTTGAFYDIVTRYPTAEYAHDVFIAFWTDVLTRDSSALDIVASLMGDHIILTRIEVYLQSIIKRAEKRSFWGLPQNNEEIRDRLEYIRDTWLDKIIASGIDPSKTSIWEPDFAFDSESQSWKLLSMPMSYKLLKKISSTFNFTEGDALQLLLRPCENAYNSKRDAIDSFNFIVQMIALSGTDTPAEKMSMVRLLREYYSNTV